VKTLSQPEKADFLVMRNSSQPEKAGFLVMKKE
jgi:hypothetical protein